MRMIFFILPEIAQMDTDFFTKTLKTPYIFSEPTACLKFR